MLQCLDHPDCAPDPTNPRPGFTVVDPGEMAVAHLIAMYPITTSEAEAMIYFAADLHFRYPAILKAMADGRMDQTIAKVLA
ncbi:HNH endonuclease, partial [Dietzia aerolata]|nr:HNH endonuclease [Dietzia aerolata]